MTLQDMCNHKEDYNDDDDDDDSDWEPFQKHVTGIQWFCTNCTMVNLDDVLYCDVCGENKDSDNLSYGSFVSRLAQEVGHTRVKSNVVNGFEGSCTRKSTLGSCTVIGFDERMLLHSEVEMKLNPHPERPDRLRAIAASLSAAGIFPGRCIPIPAREITEEELQMVHSVEHIQAVEFTSCMLSSYFTPDTYANEHSACAARLAAGLCADLSSAIMSGQAKNGFALVRPPGHHAGVKEAMGFCLHNNAAVAALAAQGVGAKKVLIVDWDVHHGNGTQEIFEGSKSVLYVSLHRHEGGRFYPGTGAADEVGIKGAEGYCVNVPWNCGGVGDNDYIFAFQHIVLPIALAFSPDLTIVSAGFDAARGDPLGCCDVTPAGYALMTHMLMSISSGKLLVILEGGYNLRSISTSATAVIKVLLGESPGCEVDGVSPSKSGLQTVLDVLRIQRKFWPNLESNLGILQAQQVSLSFKKINHDGQTIGPPHLTQSGRVSNLSPLSLSKLVGQEDQVPIDHNEQMPKPSYLCEPQNPKRSTSCIFGKANVVKGCKKPNKLMVWKNSKSKTLCNPIDFETKVKEEGQIHGSVELISSVEVVSSSNDAGSSWSISTSTSEDADSITLKINPESGYPLEDATERVRALGIPELLGSISTSTSEDAEIADSITLKINPESGYPLDDATERVRALGIPELLTAEWCDYPLSVFSDNVGNSIYYGVLYSSELRLPLRALHRNFLRSSGLCVAQIHPIVWRVLNRIDLLNRQLNQAVGVDEIFFCYTLMGVKCGDAQEVEAYTFCHRPDRPQIIIDYDVNKNWSNWARYPMRLIGNWEFDPVNEQPEGVPHQWAATCARIRPLYPKEIMRVQQTLTSFSMATCDGRLNSLDVVLDREDVLAPLFEAQIPIVLHIPPSFEDQVPLVDMDAISLGLHVDNPASAPSPEHNGLFESGTFVGSSPMKSREVLVLKQKNVVTSMEDDVSPLVAVMTEAIAPNCEILEFSPSAHCSSSQGEKKTRVSKRARVSRSSSCSREMNNSPPIGSKRARVSVNIGDGDANPIVEEQPGSSAAVVDGKGKHVGTDAYQTDVLDVGTSNANVWLSSDAESCRHLSDLMDNRVGIPCAPHDLPSYKKYDMAVRMNSPRSYHLLKAMPLDDIKMEGFNSMQRALSVLDTLQSRAEYFKDLAYRRLAKLNAANKRRSEAQVESARVTRESNTQGLRITELEATLARVLSESDARGLRITQLEADLVDVSRQLELQSRELETRELERVADVQRLEEEKVAALRDIEQNFSTQYDALVTESLRHQELQYNKGYEAGLDEAGDENEDDDEDV